MGNLGGYQLLTTWAKKVGGPKNLVAIILGTGVLGGVAIYKVGENALEKGKEAIDMHKKRKSRQSSKEVEVFYTVNEYGESNEGIEMHIGDKFRVLKTDGDAILIELIGNDNNPYFVDLNLLRTISNYK